MAQEAQEVVKSWLEGSQWFDILNTMLEFDDGIAVDSVEELKAKYDEFVEKFFHCDFRDCDVNYRKTCKNCIIAGADEDGNFYCPYYKHQ